MVDFSAKKAALNAFIEKCEIPGLTIDNLMGEGGESWVFSFSDTKVLRLYKSPKKSVNDIVSLKDFYELLSRKSTINLPVIYNILSAHDKIYTIEKKIEGTSLNKLLPKLSTEQIYTAFDHYFDSLDALHQIDVSHETIGDSRLTHSPITGETWVEYLKKKVRVFTQNNKDILSSDGFQTDHIHNTFDHKIESLFKIPISPSMVHGDMTPENVMFIPDTLEVSAIIAFSQNFTLIGDKYLDISSSIFFLDLMPEYEPTYKAIVIDIINKRYPSLSNEIIEFYHAYYSLYLAKLVKLYPEFRDWYTKSLKKFLLKRALLHK